MACVKEGPGCVLVLTYVRCELILGIDLACVKQGTGRTLVLCLFGTVYVLELTWPVLNKVLEAS